MKLYLNEISASFSFREDFDFDKVVVVLNNAIKLFKGRQDILVNLQYLKRVFDDCLLTTQQKTVLSSMVYGKLRDINYNDPAQHYYQYFRHSQLTICQVDIHSSLRIACDELINGVSDVILLNIQKSEFCSRLFIPIIRSSFDCKNREQLVHLPCYSCVSQLSDFLFLESKLKPLINNEEDWQGFIEEFRKMKTEFDYNLWNPRQISTSDKSLVLPTSNYEKLQRVIEDYIKAPNIGNTEEKIALFKNRGAIVMEINSFKKNSRLSAKYQREIYEAGTGKRRLLISLDLENGALEVIDGQDGTHLGVYSYTGNFKKKYDKQEDLNSHSLINLPKTMFLN